MPTLDNDYNDTIFENDVPFVSTAGRYGLIGGAALILYSLLSYLVLIPAGGAMMMLSGVLSFAIYIIMIALVIKHHRDEELDGYITLGRCIGVGTLTVMIAIVISSLFNYVYMNYIDPSLMDVMADAAMGFYEDILDEDQLDEMREQMKENQSGLFGAILSPLFLGVFVGLIFSTGVGLVMRKNPPHFA